MNSAKRGSAARQDLEQLVHEWLVKYGADTRISSKYRHPLISVNFDELDLVDAIETVLSTQLSMAGKVRAFEEAFGTWLGRDHCVMVNSGSSANLLATSVAADRADERGGLVATPAVTWSTTVFPLVQMGYEPAFCDVDPSTFRFDRKLGDALDAKATPLAGIKAVHLLGSPNDALRLRRLADESGAWLIEDCCEAMGGEFEGRKLGTFGDFATFSFFISHHITTGEGGMVACDDERAANLLRSKRAHGWLRERSDRDAMIAANPGFHPAFLFVSDGYNVRPTEMAGALGLRELPRINAYVRARQLRGKLWCEALQRMPGLALPLHDAEAGGHAWFALPLVLDPKSGLERAAICDRLEAAGVETRPIMGGNFTRQPVMKNYRHTVLGTLDGADLIHEGGIMVGNYPGLDLGAIDAIGRSLGQIQ